MSSAPLCPDCHRGPVVLELDAWFCPYCGEADTLEEGEDFIGKYLEVSHEPTTPETQEWRKPHG
jgi:Zn finger protein HypA/HybF involved in hydrogenase expression